MTRSLRPAASAAARLAPPGAASPLAVAFVAATLTLFATLFCAVGLAADRLATRWSGPGAEIATLQVLADEDVVEAQARAALDVLRTTDGVRSVRLIEVDEQRALLAPWFGPNLALDSLPLPLLIEVVADPDRIDRDGLVARLAVEAPGAVFDDHGAWRTPLVAAAARLRDVVVGALGLLAAALAAVIALAARSGVDANAPAVRTLRLVGARDRLIAAAFARELTLHAVVGTVFGAGLGAVALAFQPRGGEAAPVLLGLGLTGWEWLAPACVAAVASAIVWASARLAALRALRRRS